jgi:hypothetical protein
MNVVVPQDRNIHILAQKRNEQQSVYELDYQQMSAVGAASQMPWANLGVRLNGLQFSSMFHLGCATSRREPITFSFCWSCCFLLRFSSRVGVGVRLPAYVKAWFEY